MSSQRKIDSARTNGAKSHGPKTEEGRKKSAMNTVTHGLYAESVVLNTESPEEHREMLEAYIQQFQPDGQATGLPPPISPSRRSESARMRCSFANWSRISGSRY